MPGSVFAVVALVPVALAIITLVPVGAALVPVGVALAVAAALLGGGDREDEQEKHALRSPRCRGVLKLRKELMVEFKLKIAQVARKNEA